jgi:hypothetical protein
MFSLLLGGIESIVSVDREQRFPGAMLFLFMGGGIDHIRDLAQCFCSPTERIDQIRGSGSNVLLFLGIESIRSMDRGAMFFFS